MFLGGGLGAFSRYQLGAWLADRWPVVPWGTALINISGSLLIGLFMVTSFHLKWSPDWRPFFAVGVLGGYTTFSSFSYEAMGLVEQGSFGWALGYVLFNVLLSLGGCWLGIAVARALVGAA